MEQNTHMAQDDEETRPVAQIHTKKINNPKSALSYSEIIQLRQNKHGGGGGCGGGDNNRDHDNVPIGKTQTKTSAGTGTGCYRMSSLPGWLRG